MLRTFCQYQIDKRIFLHCVLILLIFHIVIPNHFHFLLQYALGPTVECPFRQIVSTTTEISGIDTPIAHTSTEIWNWPGFKMKTSTSLSCNIFVRSRVMSSYPMLMSLGLYYLPFKSSVAEPCSSWAFTKITSPWLSPCPRCIILNYLLWEVRPSYHTVWKLLYVTLTLKKIRETAF